MPMLGPEVGAWEPAPPVLFVVVCSSEPGSTSRIKRLAGSGVAGDPELVEVEASAPMAAPLATITPALAASLDANQTTAQVATHQTCEAIGSRFLRFWFMTTMVTPE